MTIAPPDSRAASPTLTRFQQLGPPVELPGTWLGHGSNLIARPGRQGGNDIFLGLNPTDEHLVLAANGGAPSAGSTRWNTEFPAAAVHPDRAAELPAPQLAARLSGHAPEGQLNQPRAQ